MNASDRGDRSAGSGRLFDNGSEPADRVLRYLPSILSMPVISDDCEVTIDFAIVVAGP